MKCSLSQSLGLLYSLPRATTHNGTAEPRNRTRVPPWGWHTEKILSGGHDWMQPMSTPSLQEVDGRTSTDEKPPHTDGSAA